MSAINFPPSVIIPVRQGSKLVPPLGDLDPETRHLNLSHRWNYRLAEKALIASPSPAAPPALINASGGPDSTEDASPRSDPRSSSPSHEGNREAAGAAVAGVGNSERGTP